MSQSPEQKPNIFTPFNIVAAIIIIGGAVLALLRFTQGLGALGEGSHTQPWGIFIGFNLLCGVPLSAGGFVIGTAVFLFGMKEYRPIVRPAVLVGFMGYLFVVIALLVDVGRPWRLHFPMLAFDIQDLSLDFAYGVTSVLFLVGWHVALYLSCQFVEFSPAVFEWLTRGEGASKDIVHKIANRFFGWINWGWFRKIAIAVTIGATVFGVILSTLHQSALGGLFLITPTKVHPLWYSEFIPLFFFVSAIAGGLSMVIFEAAIAHRFFSDKVEISKEQLDKITIGLGKAASIVLAVYFSIKMVGLAGGNHWHYLGTGMGHWYLLEMIGFVLAPCILYSVGVRENRPRLIRFTAVLTILGIMLNRVNTALVAFNWKLPSDERFTLHWMEVWLSIAVITTGLLTYRWIVTHLPVWKHHPKYPSMH